MWANTCTTQQGTPPIEPKVFHSFCIVYSSQRLTTGKNEQVDSFVCPCHEIYRIEAVGLSISNNIFKNHDFCEYVKFWAISWKFDILSITASLKFQSKNPFTYANLKIVLHMYDMYNCNYPPHTMFRFLFIDFPLNTDLPPQL